MDAPLSGSSVAETLGNAFRLNSDRQRQGQEAFTASPFSRLLITHVLSLGGDAVVTLALAGSLFFSTPLHAARGKVALTLLLTIAPFAVVAPLLGPIIDKTRGGRRMMVVATALGRAVACFLMVRYLKNSYLLYPAAFLALVCSKGYSVAKSTLVPSAVQRPQDLVEANSKLAVSGAVAGFLIAIPGLAILKLAGGQWLLRGDAVLFLACAASALRLQITEERVAVARAGEVDDTAILVEEGTFPAAAARREVRAKPLPAGTIEVAAFAMGMLRSMVGFLTFLVAFGFRHSHAPTWWYGVVLACSIGGNLIGAAVAPWLRTRLREELILAGSSATVAVAGVLALFFMAVKGRPAASLLAGVVGLAAGAAKLSFDALVQRHVPAESQGRAFGRFEAGFQLVWVVGGLVPVVIPLSLRSGFLIVTLAAALAAAVHVVGTRLARLGQLPAWWPGVRPRAQPRR
ncbi:MAG: MFS transporter, partial [Actinomycetota bacterium]|nr:MFS transporter [Actinomycetota bacterium]